MELMKTFVPGLYYYA